jgi:membrane associated rhomboid family serine protease
MLIIPIEQKLDPTRPPVATLLLIVLNLLVFFGYQAGDVAQIEKIAAYYEASGLYEYEAPVYAEFLRADDPDLLEDFQELEAAQAGMQIATDPEFAHYLHSKHFMGSGIALDWMDARRVLDAQIAELSFMRYGFIPADFSVVDMLVSMFLHGDLGHLLGNMLFLFIFGFSLEAALGRRWYLSIYLLSGIAGSLLTWIIMHNSHIPTVGASGAIFGLLGMYLGLYGMKKIKFFCTVGFYARNFTAPALVLLPYWLLIELYAQFTVRDNVAHFVHLGGLLAGFACVYWGKQRWIKIDQGYVDKIDAGEPYRQLYDKFLRQLEHVELSQAKRSLQELLTMHPGDKRLLRHQFDLNKLKPANEAFETVAKQLFVSHDLLPGDKTWLHRALNEYEQLSKTHVALDAAGRTNLCNFFLRAEDFAAVNKQIVALENDEAAQTKVPGLLLRIANGLLARGNKERALNYLDRLRDRYPDSDAAQEAKSIKV